MLVCTAGLCPLCGWCPLVSIDTHMTVHRKYKHDDAAGSQADMGHPLPPHLCLCAVVASSHDREHNVVVNQERVQCPLVSYIHSDSDRTDNTRQGYSVQCRVPRVIGAFVFSGLIHCLLQPDERRA